MKAKNPPSAAIPEPPDIQSFPPAKSPRSGERLACRAKTRTGEPCQELGLANGRCRLHGGLSPGAPRGNANATKHGRYSRTALAKRAGYAELLRGAYALARALDGEAADLRAARRNRAGAEGLYKFLS